MSADTGQETGTGQDAAEPRLEPGSGGRRGPRWKLTLMGLIGVYLTLACYALVTVFTSGGAGLSSSASASTSASTAPATHGAASVSSSPSDLPAPTLATVPASHPLAVASVAAFGPEGTADGDNPGIVYRIGAAGQPWYSAWYATPEFGNLQAGTGLLFDMGHAVSVSSVRLTLGSQPGADVQVLVGNSPTLDGLTTAASATDAAGNVRLSVTSPSAGRYVLVWFTRLPPNGQEGQYQVDVYGVTIDGIRA